MGVNSWTFDVLLAILSLLSLLFIGRKLLPPFPWDDIWRLLTISHLATDHPFSLRRAYSAYARYATLANQEVTAMEYSYRSVGRSHKQLGFRIGYPSKLNQLRKAVEQNARLTKAIGGLAAEEFGLDNSPSDVNHVDLGRVREALKHIVRDWSEEGRSEREKIFQPIFQVLNQIPFSERAGVKVLVPGSGLGRLAWEISQLGFRTTAVEFSYFMTLAMRFLFSPKATVAKNGEHHIQPFAHWFSHQRSNELLFRVVSFPDVVPRFTPTLELIEGDFLKLAVPLQDRKRRLPSTTPGSPTHGYDFVVTLFFIDTSVNVFATIEKIHCLLRPGGVWINLGPLLWPGGAQAKTELSLEEVMSVVREIGFFVYQTGDPNDVHASRTIECEYTSDKNAMMRWIYCAEFWVAIKQHPT